jgi:hypothetical protein
LSDFGGFSQKKTETRLLVNKKTEGVKFMENLGYTIFRSTFIITTIPRAAAGFKK